MPKPLAAFATLITLVSATTAEAKGVSLRCEMEPAKFSTGLVPLDRQLNEGHQPVDTRYYIIDDVARNIWIVSDGQKRPLCMKDEQCNLTYTASRIFVRSSGSNNYDFTLDRISGTLSETITASSKDGVKINFYNRGSCVPETNLAPKF